MGNGIIQSADEVDEIRKDCCTFLIHDCNWAKHQCVVKTACGDQYRVANYSIENQRHYAYGYKGIKMNLSNEVMGIFVHVGIMKEDNIYSLVAVDMRLKPGLHVYATTKEMHYVPTNGRTSSIL
eukprot:9128245-Ditylum_brightwellii.AAC.1